MPDPDDVWGPPWELDLDALRRDRAAADAEVGALSGPPVPVASVVDRTVGGVPCRVYDPDPSGAVARGAVVYAHGGGWIGGSVTTVDGVCRRLAVGTGAVVVSVDYRLAPEHRFPAAVDDVDAVVAAVQGGDVGGLDGAGRVAVAGDSAGGHLATVAARRARDAGRPVSFQALVYPVVDAVGIRDGAPSVGLDMGFARGEMVAYWDAFLPEGGVRDLRDPDVSPAHADLSGMPPTFLLLAGHDVLTPEGEAYAEALLDAGVEVTVAAYPRMAHGFLRRLAIFAEAGVAVDQVARVVRGALGR